MIPKMWHSGKSMFFHDGKLDGTSPRTQMKFRLTEGAICRKPVASSTWNDSMPKQLENEPDLFDHVLMPEVYGKLY